MTRIILAALATVAVIATAAPAFAADTIGPKIAACVEKGAFIKVDGKDFNLRAGADFKVVLNPAYNQYGVTWQKRIQADNRWAHAEKVARGCIDEATVGKVAKK